MHPPVLDDLGLVPAIEAAAHAVPSPPVAITIENRTGCTRAERPPQEVELAAYRIVVEAIANAVRHADARHITVNGAVADGRVRRVTHEPSASGPDLQAVRLSCSLGQDGTLCGTGSWPPSRPTILKGAPVTSRSWPLDIRTRSNTLPGRHAPTRTSLHGGARLLVAGLLVAAALPWSGAAVRAAATDMAYAFDHPAGLTGGTGTSYYRADAPITVDLKADIVPYLDIVAGTQHDILGSTGFHLWLIPPLGGSIGIGTYPNAGSQASNPDQPRIGLVGSGVGCDATPGWFRVDELTTSGSTVTSLAATALCYSGDAPLVIEVRFHSTRPIPPGVEATPNRTFPQTVVGSTSEPLIAVFTTVGGSDLHPGRARLVGSSPADFEIVADECAGATVGPSETCTVSVRFHPADGPSLQRSAIVEVPDDSVAAIHRTWLYGSVRRPTSITIASAQNPNTLPDATTINASVTPEPNGGTVEWSVNGVVVKTVPEGTAFTMNGRTGPYTVSARYLGSPWYLPSSQSNTVDQVTYAESSVRFDVWPARSGQAGAVDVTAYASTAAGGWPPGGILSITDETTGAVLGLATMGQEQTYVYLPNMVFQGLHILRGSYAGVAPYILAAQATVAVEGTTGVDPAAATDFYVGGLASVSESGTPGTVSISALDTHGRIDTGYTGTVHLTSSDPGAALAGDATFSGEDRGRIILPLTLTTAGLQSVTATDVGNPAITGSATVSVAEPVVQPTATALSVSRGIHHACALLEGGTVRCWGRNESGQLGDGTTQGSRTPVAVAGIGPAVAIAAGGDHTCAILSDSTVSCWGANEGGQLGDGTTTPHSEPVVVSSIVGATAITADGSRTCALLAAGTASCWGWGLAPRAGGADPVPVPVPGLAGIVDISAGYPMCAVLDTGTVWCWGSNSFGELGNGTETDSATPVQVQGITTATQVTAGEGHACALLIGGTIRCWGDGSRGQLGDGSTTTRSVPISVPGIVGAIAVEALGASTCAILTDHTTACWGANDLGQIGDGTSTDRHTPVAGGAHAVVATLSAAKYGACAVHQAGDAVCWGSNRVGELGDGVINRYVPTATAAMPAVSTVATLWGSTCALMTDGTVRCWGSREGGPLGDGVGEPSSVPVLVPGIASAVQVAGTGSHACARLADGTLRCWGQGYVGQLGDGRRFVTGSAPVTVTGITTSIDVAPGNNHTCAALADGTVWCWGGASAVPAQVDGITTATAVEAAAGFSCALLADHTVQCWGANSAGQLGNGSTTDSDAPVVVTGVTTATAITLLDQAACALLADQTVRCWGSNAAGQLGNGSTAPSTTAVPVVGLIGATAVAGGAQHACARLDDGSVKCWGANSLGQLGDGTALNRATPVIVGGLTAASIDASSGHTCAVLGGGAARCWGDDTSGQLGIGRHPYAALPVAVDLAIAPRLRVVLDAPAASGSLVVPVAFGVLPGGGPATGYLVSTSPDRPPGSPAAWTAAPPASVGLTAGDRMRTIYAWVRNDRGVVSEVTTAVVRLDTTKPTAAVVAPAATKTRTIAVTASGADAGTGVAAWLLTEQPNVPAAGDPRWTGARPTGLTLSAGDGSKRLYLWTRDGVNNVSAPAWKDVRLDTAPPTGGGAPGAPAVASGTARTTVPVGLRWPSATDPSGVRYELAYQVSGATSFKPVTLSSATARTATVALAPGTYRFRVRAVDAAGNVTSWRTGSWVTVRRLQETSSSISLTSGFRRTTSSAASGGGFAYAHAKGNSATVRLTGRSIAWVSSRGTNRGIAKVWLDGRLVATVDLYSTTTQAARVVWRTSFASSGTHTVRIVVTGTKRRASDGTRVDIDAFTTTR